MLSVLGFVFSYYFSSEKKRNEFLIDRIKSAEVDERKKTKRMLDIEDKLEDIGSKMTATELIDKSNLFAGASFIIFLLMGMLPLAMLFGAIGMKFPEIYLSIKKEKINAEFIKQLPDSIESLLAVLQSGQTPIQGYKILSQDAPFPARHEFHRIYNDIQTGASQEKALTDFYHRHPIPDIKLFMTGMIIAAEATPAVAINTLRTIRNTIQTRESQKKSAKSTIMQGKGTAFIMSGIPVLAFVVMTLLMPGYIAPMLDSELGQIMIGVALVLDAIGFAVALKITSASSIVKY